MRSGGFQADWGTKYDLGDRNSRQALADDGAKQWVNEVVQAIKAVDSEVLTTSSVFSPKEVFRKGYDGVYFEDAKWGDPRQPFRLKALEESAVDYLQIHPYPHNADYKIEIDLKSLEFGELKRSKPILIGEFGTYKKDFTSPEKALDGLSALLQQACEKGLDGWLFWTWDTVEQTHLWHMKEKESFLAKALSPNARTWCVRWAPVSKGKDSGSRALK